MLLCRGRLSLERSGCGDPDDVDDVDEIGPEAEGVMREVGVGGFSITLLLEIKEKQQLIQRLMAEHFKV